MNEAWTPEAAARLRDYLARPGYTIPVGLGTEDAACSIAAINLALSGVMTDDIPECMSLVIGVWVRTIQDMMPEAIRNSPKWIELLPLAAGTGREQDYEHKRLDMVLDWMWGTVLPQSQLAANQEGCGRQWKSMCAGRTQYLAVIAYMAADRCGALNLARRADSAREARKTALALQNFKPTWSNTSTFVVKAVQQACQTAMRSRTSPAWGNIDPVGMLTRLINLPGRKNNE